MTQSGNITALADKWELMLRSCRYAGEVYLDPEQLHYLASHLGQKVNVRGNAYETALLVLAVNCAYHYYDDLGFWYHFCHLLDIENTTEVQTRFGIIIEKRMKLLKLNKSERIGPFRYVGAILEQCGVSKRHIASFAAIIKNMKGSGSWDDIIFTDQKEFQQRVGEFYCSQYLKSFLEDQSGWEFTVQVCRLLRYHEQELFSREDLKEIPGFQPGFWEEFLDSIYHTGPPPRNRIQTSMPASVSMKPRLVFVPDESCVGIHFPSPDHATEVTLPKIAGLWKFPLTLLKEDRAWASRYTGLISLSDGSRAKWAVAGWIPDGLPALFHPTSGLVQRGSFFSSGEYWLLVPDGCQPQGKLLLDAGPVKVPGNVNYRAFRVLLEAGDSIPGYASETDSKTGVFLEWVDPERHRFHYAVSWMDVFSGSLPELAVSDFRAVKERRFAIFYNAGNAYGVIKNQQDLERVISEINGMAPVAGRFSVFDTGRSSNKDNSGIIFEIAFHLLPLSKIIVDQRLLAFNEEVPVELETSCPASLWLDGCRHESGDKRQWTVPVSLRCADGVIRFSGVTVSVSIPVHRARIHYADGRVVRYLPPGELKCEESFLVGGYPDSEALLGMAHVHNIHIPLYFDNGGMAHVSPGQLSELFARSDLPAVEITLTSHGHTVSTGSVIIEPDTIIASVTAGTFISINVCTENNLSKMLAICTEICRGSSDICRYNLNHIPGFHPLLDENLLSILACASVFDGIDIRVRGELFDWKEMVSNNDLRLLLDFVLEAQGGRMFGNISPFTVSTEALEQAIPAVERWRTLFRKYLKLYTVEEGLPDIEEWAEEIRRHQISFRSNIGQLPGGHALGSAWVSYHRGLFEKALALAATADECPRFLAELRDILRVLLLLRLARPQAATEMLEARREGGGLQSVFELLYEIIYVLKGERDGNIIGQLPEVIESVPLRAQDLVFLKTASGCDPTGGPEASRLSGGDDDWFLLWWFVVTSADSLKIDELSAMLRQMEKGMPPSPEKTNILEQLKRLQG